MAVLFTHIRSLVNVREHLAKPLRGAALSHLPLINDAWLLAEGENIADYGAMEQLPGSYKDIAEQVDCTGRLLLPCWCDSHTHLVFAGSRETEFVDKIRGANYAEIAAKGGGILSSARKVAEATENELFEQSLQRLNELIRLGTGAIEIKSGYGLSLESEMKMLRVIQRLKATAPIPVKATFLGAHALPAEYRENRKGYISLVTGTMLPQVAAAGLADYIDVFCEAGFFTPEETVEICQAGIRFGLKPKVHANQLQVSGGVEAGVQVGALSVDHLESMDAPAIGSLAGSNTIGTLLPGAAFFLRMQYPPVRQMLDVGCALALASDFNPGSSPSGNMNLVISLACIQMRMTPEEAINAATINGAFAMEVQDITGSISIGKKANLVLTRPVPSLAYLPYAFGSNLVDRVMIAGNWLS